MEGSALRFVVRKRFAPPSRVHLQHISYEFPRSPRSARKLAGLVALLLVLLLLHVHSLSIVESRITLFIILLSSLLPHPPHRLPLPSSSPPPPPVPSSPSAASSSSSFSSPCCCCDSFSVCQLPLAPPPLRENAHPPVDVSLSFAKTNLTINSEPIKIFLDE